MIIRLLNTFGLDHPRPYRRRVWLMPHQVVELATCRAFILRNERLRAWRLCVHHHGPGDPYRFYVLDAGKIDVPPSGLRVIPRAVELGACLYPLRWLLEFQASTAWPEDWAKSLPQTNPPMR